MLRLVLCLILVIQKMLKNNFKNQRLKKRMLPKETIFVLHYLFRSFLKKKKFSAARFNSYLMHYNANLLFQLPFSKARTICFLTGRSRSVYRTFHLSRLKLREFAAAGYFNGLAKAS